MKSLSDRGFTLIEVMVVCTIVLILMTIAYVAYNSARESARDEKRATDLEIIKVGLRLYVEEYGSYPDCDHGIKIEIGGGTVNGGQCPDGAQLQSFLTSYFGSSGLISDPQGPGDGSFYYYYDGDRSCNDPSGSSNTARVVFAVNTQRPSNSNLNDVCGSASGNNNGGWLNTPGMNPSSPYVVILERL